jgi:PAS domain S-box-containing protein
MHKINLPGEKDSLDAPKLTGELAALTGKQMTELAERLAILVELLSEMARSTLHERKAAQHFQKREEHYRILINSLPQFIYEADLQGTVVFANQAALETFGYSAVEIVGKTHVSQFISPHDREKVTQRFKAVLSGHTLSPEEYWFLRKNGTSFPGVVISRSIEVDGAVVGVRGVIIDNSSRWHVEEQLRESEQRYRTLYDGANDVILILENGLIVECNRRAQDLFQRLPQDLVGSSLFNLSPPLQSDGQLSAFKADKMLVLNGTDASGCFEWDFLLKDGAVLETEVSLNTIEMEGKSLTLAIFRDITERNQIRRALEKQESAWRAIFEHAPYGIVINRLRDGVYLDANPAYELFSGGKRRCDILGKTLEEVLPPVQLEKSAQVKEVLLSKGSIHNQEATSVAVDGSERHILYSSAVFHAGSEPCALSMFVDITEHKKIEAQLRHNENVLKSLFQAVPVGLAILKGRRFLAVNQQVSDITGHTAADLIDHSSRHLYETEEEYLRVRHALYDPLWEQGTSYVETQFKRRDGSLYHVSLYAAPLDRNSPEAGAAVAIQDISERVEMLQSLRDSEHRFRKTAELSGQLIYDYDVDSSAIFWSGRIEDITGYSFEEFNSFGFAGWMERVHPDDLSATLAQLELACHDQTLFSVDYRFRRADHTYFHVHEEGAYLYDDQGKPVRMLGTVKDVSLQTAAEEALRCSEARLALAISAATDAIWEWYPQSQRTYFSPRWYEMLGYGEREITKTHNAWTEYCHPDDLPAGSSAVKAVLTSPANPQFAIECRMHHRDGHWLWILSRGKVMEWDAAGAPLLVTGTIADITNRKLAELALRESEHRYRTLFESGRDAIFILKDDVVADCNNKTLEIFQYSRHQFIGLSPQQFSPSMQPDGRTFAEHGKGHIDKALLGHPQQFEWMHSRQDGTLFHADVRLGSIELSGETCLQCVVRDITERKKTESALRESEFRFRSFFNTSPEGILLVDFQGLLLDVNKAFLLESGYLPEECTRKHFKEFVPLEDQGRIVEAIVAFKSGIAQDQPLYFSYHTKDGSLVPVMAKGWLVVDEKSNPLYLGVFIHNLSKELALAEEKAALEKQVLQAQRSEAIGTLAGGIAHDFNNILGGIIGFSELALHRVAPTTDAKVREYLQRVLEGGNRAKDLVQQILRFSRHTDTVMEPINLVPVIKESIRLMRSTLPSTITIQHQFYQISDRIMGDPTQIHQVVMNLATNALHALKENGGLLSITLNNVFLDSPRQFLSMAIQPGEYLQLQVSDTGCGMPPAVVERIFEPYFTTKKINEGTGLGMAVVLGIIKSHQGLIEIASAVGEGTRFDIYLPLTQEDAAQNDKAHPPLPMGRGERVLLVDDEIFFLEVIRESLQLLGYQVATSTSSVSALHMFTTAPRDYDLLITDQTMPEMTGVQLIREVRQINRNLPIILCTGYSEIVTEQSAAYYGISQFLMKPVNTNDLAQAVAAVLHSTTS